MLEKIKQTARDYLRLLLGAPAATFLFALQVILITYCFWISFFPAYGWPLGLLLLEVFAVLFTFGWLSYVRWWGQGFIVMGNSSLLSYPKLLWLSCLSYIPFSLSLLHHVLFNSWSHAWLAGLLLTLVAKGVLFLYVKPERAAIQRLQQQVKGEQGKASLQDRFNGSAADVFYSSLIPSNADVIRKYRANGEVRNAIKLSDLKAPFTVKIDAGNPEYLIGFERFQRERGKFQGHLKVFLQENDGTEKLILNKEAKLIPAGWNRYALPVKGNPDTATLRIENSITTRDIYFSAAQAPLIKKKTGRNIIVIIMDSLVPDVLGLYNGEKRGDKLSLFFQEGEFSRRAYTQGEWTMPCLSSICTSRYTSHHGVNDPDLYSRKIPETMPTMAELLQREGFNTYGVGTGPRTSPGYGFARGYYRYKYQNPFKGNREDYYDQREIVYDAIRFLKENQGQDNFLFLHFYDLICNNYPFFQNAENLSQPADALFNQSEYEVKMARKRGEAVSAEAIEYLRELYTQKWKETDDVLQLFFDYINDHQKENTAVLMTADHGMNIFGDISEMIVAGRKRNLHDNIINVPFMLRCPWLDLDNLRDKFVEANLTILPTVLDMAGLAAPADIYGNSVFGKNKGRSPQKDYTISESVYKGVYELAIKSEGFDYFCEMERERKSGRLTGKVMEEDLNLHLGSVDEKAAREKISSMLRENDLPQLPHVS